MDHIADANALSLCNACYSLCSTQSQLDRLITDTGYALHDSLQSLKDSAAQGCRFCRLLTDTKYAISRMFVHHLNDPKDYEVFLKGKRDRGGSLQKVELYVVKNESEERARLLEKKTQGRGEPWFGGWSHMLMSPDWKPPALRARFAHDKMMAFNVQLRPGSEDHNDLTAYTLHAQSDFAWGVIRKWVRTCENHPSCAHKEPTLPLRVIDVGVRHQGDSYDAPKLLATNGTTGRYVALSYCWGGQQKIVTKIANVDDHMQRLPMDSLSQSILDAITVCRQLNLRYLWVDALCIVQDDEVAKLAEIARMHEIYKNATLTIVAASAKSAEEGFLRPTALPSCSLPCISASGDTELAVLSAVVVDAKNTTSRFWSQDAAILWPPTEERAWTCQEVLLSPRKLTYGMLSLEWECLSGKETFTGDGFVFTETLASASSRNPPPVNFFAGPSYTPSLKSIIISWAEFVEDFSSRCLTNSEDKLSAMSAIAAEYHRISGWTYAAGLWRETMIIDLFWQLDTEFEGLRKAQPRSWPDTQRPVTYRAPSWSWTAVDGLIKPGCKQDLMFSTEVAEIVDIIPEHHPEAPFGRLLGCTLVVIAQLCSMQKLPWDPYEDDDNLMFDFEPRKVPEDDRDGCSLLWVANTLPEESAEEPDEESHDGLAAGLLVMPAEGKDGFWRRIGIFHSIPPKYFEDQPRSKLQLV